MAHLFRIHNAFFLILVFMLVTNQGHSQTVCTYRVPVPDLDMCDASGGLEDNINAGVFEVKGNIRGMQDYQSDNFKHLDQQINKVLKVTSRVDTEISDIGNELDTLKRTFGNIQSLQMHGNSTGAAPNSSGRGKRAVPTNQLARDLNAVKQAFQQSVLALDTKLRILGQQVKTFEQQTTDTHRRYQTQLTQNQQDLTTTEAQLTAIMQTVNSLAAGGTALGSVSVPGASSLRQDVADLVVDAKTAENVAQRQIDSIDKKTNRMQAIEQTIKSDLQTTKTILNDTQARINNVEQQTLQTTIAERIFGDLVGELVTNNTLKITDATTLVTNTSATLAQLGTDVLKNIVTAKNMGQEIAKTKQELAGVQSLVTLNQGVSRGQSTDLLDLRRRLLDDIHVLQYAFGARKSPP